MAENHKRRERKMDFNRFNPKQADDLGKAIGKEISKIFDNANNEANKLLNIYSLQTKITYEIISLGKKKA